MRKHPITMCSKVDESIGRVIALQIDHFKLCDTMLSLIGQHEDRINKLEEGQVTVDARITKLEKAKIDSNIRRIYSVLLDDALKKGKYNGLSYDLAKKELGVERKELMKANHFKGLNKDWHDLLVKDEALRKKLAQEPTYKAFVEYLKKERNLTEDESILQLMFVLDRNSIEHTVDEYECQDELIRLHNKETQGDALTGLDSGARKLIETYLKVA